MKEPFIASVWKEGEWHIAKCIQVASQFVTEDEALANLRDALELHFTSLVATCIPHIRDIEIDIRAA